MPESLSWLLQSSLTFVSPVIAAAQGRFFYDFYLRQPDFIWYFRCQNLTLKTNTDKIYWLKPLKVNQHFNQHLQVAQALFPSEDTNV